MSLRSAVIMTVSEERDDWRGGMMYRGASAAPRSLTSQLRTKEQQRCRHCACGKGKKPVSGRPAPGRRQSVSVCVHGGSARADEGGANSYCRYSGAQRSDPSPLPFAYARTTIGALRGPYGMPRTGVGTLDGVLRGAARSAGRIAGAERVERQWQSARVRANLCMKNAPRGHTARQASFSSCWSVERDVRRIGRTAWNCLGAITPSVWIKLLGVYPYTISHHAYGRRSMYSYAYLFPFGPSDERCGCKGNRIVRSNTIHSRTILVRICGPRSDFANKISGCYSTSTLLYSIARVPAW